MNTYAIATLKNKKKIVIPATKEGKPDRVVIDKSIQRELNQLKHREARRERHETQRMLTTGGWEEDDRYQQESFSPDIIGEAMPQNPGGFGFSLSALIGGAK
jgi:hypothetical protein